MSYDGFYLNSQIEELKSKLLNSRIEKIYQLNEYELVFIFHNVVKYVLLISVSNNSSRMVIIDRKPQMPENASMFCMFLRKHFLNAILLDIKQLEFERVVEFEFICKNEIGDTVNKKFIFEIMGKHSNFIVVGNDYMILDSLKHIGKNKSIRPIYGGIFYEKIPTIKENLFELNKENFLNVDYIYNKTLLSSRVDLDSFKDKFYNMKLSKILNSYYQGVSKDIADIILKKSEIEDIVYLNVDENIKNKIYDVIQNLKLELFERKFYIYLDENENCRNISAIKINSNNLVEVEEKDGNKALLRYFLENRNENTYTNKINIIKNYINKNIEKLKNKCENLKKDIEEAQNLDIYKLYAELLTANLYIMKKGMKEIEVLNYYENKMILIPLSDKLKPNENAQRYYKKYSKAKMTLVLAKKYLQETNEEILYLENVLLSLDNIENDDDIFNIKEELFLSGYDILKNKKIKIDKKKVKNKFEPMVFKSTSGIEIKVGKNSLQNDELTLKKSNKEYIWLHIKDMAGSHVVIQESIEKIDENTLIEAAEIAAFYSKAKYSSNVAIDYTQVKNVKKPKGAKYGMVIYENNRTIYVTPDEKKIKKLFLK